MNRYTDMDLALTKLLLNRIQARKGMITYGECAAELSSLLGRKENAHFGLTIPLGNVCDLCYKNGVPFIVLFLIVVKTLVSTESSIMVLENTTITWHGMMATLSMAECVNNIPISIMN